MSQKFLDPRNIPRGCQNCLHVPATLPLAVRELGHLPDLAQLLPGDLILFSPLEPTFIQKQIQKAQTIGGYHPDNARWTHAAVYLGSQFDICEASINQGCAAKFVAGLFAGSPGPSPSRSHTERRLEVENCSFRSIATGDQLWD